jgi:hypothetical protein
MSCYEALKNITALNFAPESSQASSFAQAMTNKRKGHQEKTSTMWAQLQSISNCSKQRQTQGIAHKAEVRPTQKSTASTPEQPVDAGVERFALRASDNNQAGLTGCVHTLWSDRIHKPKLAPR